jgi:DNA modification methylase
MGDERDGIYEKTGVGLKHKDLVGIPWRVAFALQADGWYLRQDIIWAKPNPMPESVTDRCTKSHEYIFLLTKSPKYYFNSEAIKEPVVRMWDESNGGNLKKGGKRKVGENETQNHDVEYPKCDGFRNKRSVWTVNTKPFREAHFATYPEDLIIPMIKTTREKAIILDPFFGAGTTGLVALKLDRSYIGIELNPKYIDIAEKRIKSISNKLF